MTVPVPDISDQVNEFLKNLIDTCIQASGLSKEEFMERAVKYTGHQVVFQPYVPPANKRGDGGNVIWRHAVLDVLRRGGEFTPADIAHSLGQQENFVGAASAYCRDLRKRKNGGYDIAGAKRDHGYTYRLVENRGQ